MNNLHNMEQFLFDNLGGGTTLLQINTDDCPPTEVLIEADVWDREDRPHSIKITDPSTENNVSLKTVFNHVERLANKETPLEVWSDKPPVVSKRKKRKSAPIGSVIEVPIDEITIKKRIRKEYGDLKELAESIKNDGLLQPIGVDYRMTLIFGHRRLLACRDELGWKSIPVRVLEVGSILDGEIAENVMRMDFTVSERVAIGNLIEKQMPERRGKRKKIDGLNGRSDDIAAKRAGFGNRQTYRQAKTIIESCTPDVIGALDDGRLSISAASVLADEKPSLQNAALKKSNNLDRLTANRVKKHLRRAKRAKEKAEAGKRPIRIPKPTDAIKILHSDFRNLKVNDESVDLIFTDLPYPQEFLPLWDDLGTFAARVLKPNGILASYSGQYYLDKVFVSLGKRLTYRWMISTSWEGDRNQIRPMKINNGWKPILVYSKGEWGERAPWSDTSFVKGKEKDDHDWQQNLEEVQYYVRAFSNPGDLICDPCGGSFTTAEAVRRLGDRRFIGCDIDESCVGKGQERIRKGSGG
jgi:ParB-like chromosome segregation protein Spo0J